MNGFSDQATIEAVLCIIARGNQLGDRQPGRKLTASTIESPSMNVDCNRDLFPVCSLLLSEDIDSHAVFTVLICFATEQLLSWASERN